MVTIMLLNEHMVHTRPAPFFYHSYPIFVFLFISNSLLADKDGLSELVNALIDSIRAMLALKFQY